MSSSYTFGEFFVEYIRWHYGRGFAEFIGITRNFFKFLVHFFSFKLLFRTLFSPWKRMGEQYERGLHIESALSTLLVNTIMRVVGLVSRLAIIILGTISLVVFVLLAFTTSIVWLLMPLVMAALFLAGFFLIYASI